MEWERKENLSQTLPRPFEAVGVQATPAHHQGVVLVNQVCKRRERGASSGNELLCELAIKGSKDGTQLAPQEWVFPF